jgi:type I restriction enzyme S subunit
MENIIQLISGRDMKKNEYNDKNEGIPYITGASNIKNNEILINRWTKTPITIAYKGDLLLTCKGTIGELIILNETKAHIARQIMSLRTSNNINSNYLKYFLESYVLKLKNVAKSMIPGISREDVLSILFPLPSLKEQERIVKKIDEFNLLIKSKKINEFLS